MESVKPDVSKVVLFSPLMVSRAITDAALLSAICYPAMVAVSNQDQIITPHTHTHTSQITGVCSHSLIDGNGIFLNLSIWVSKMSLDVTFGRFLKGSATINLNDFEQQNWKMTL